MPVKQSNIDQHPNQCQWIYIYGYFFLQIISHFSFVPSIFFLNFEQNYRKCMDIPPTYQISKLLAFYPPYKLWIVSKDIRIYKCINLLGS
jgi:hypothetical protein